MSNAPSTGEGTPLFDPHMFPHGRRTLPQLILDHNPCFLLSTLLMLLGCYLLNSAMDVRAGDAGKLFGLLSVINLYEVCIIALGLVLVRRRRSPARDGMWLLLFETLFLVDGTFLIAETVEANEAWGWAVNLLLLVLAIAKGLMILRGMRIRLGARTAGFLALQLGVVYVLPIVLQRISVDGVVSPRAMYAVWWIVGLLPALYEALARLEPAAAARLGPVQQAVRRAYVIIPWILVVAHAGLMHWVYHADYYAADLAPVLLGIAVASLRIGATKAVPSDNLAVFRVVLPITGILLSMRDNPLALEWIGSSTRLTPAEFAVGGALLAWGYFISLRMAAVAGASIALAVIGYVWREWIDAFYRLAWKAEQVVEDMFMRLLPRTAEAWGVCAILSAFLLLAIGGIVSLRRQHLTSPDSPSDAPAS